MWRTPSAGAARSVPVARAPSPRRRAPRSVAEYIRTRRPLSVSDIARPAWCEYEYQYALLSQSHLPLAQRPRTIATPEGHTLVPSYVALLERERRMSAGTGVHAAIEQAVHPDQVELRTETPADRWAVRFLDAAAGVRAAAAAGRAREIPVFGVLGGRPVFGIVDELRRSPDGQSLVLAETKSRRARTLPSDADQRQARIQCMLYRRLYEEMRGTLELAHLSEALGLSCAAPLSAALTDDLATPGAAPWPVPRGATLGDVAARAQTSLRAALPLAAHMELVYVQRDGSSVGTVSFADDELDTYLAHIAPLFAGTRLPQGVPESLTPRCNSCAWRDGCEWRAKMAAAHADDALWREYTDVSDDALAKLTW